MGADGERRMTLFGLEVTDEAGYAQYHAVRERWLTLSVGGVDVLEEAAGGRGRARSAAQK
jgi:hypothetical protein